MTKTEWLDLAIKHIDSGDWGKAIKCINEVKELLGESKINKPKEKNLYLRTSYALFREGEGAIQEDMALYVIKEPL